MRMGEGLVPRRTVGIIKTQKVNARNPFGERAFCCHSDSLNVLGLPALRSFGHVELDGLPFLQAAKAASLNSGEMHEDILPILTADEAIAFGVVKPLYCSLFH